MNSLGRAYPRELENGKVDRHSKDIGTGAGHDKREEILQLDF